MRPQKVLPMPKPVKHRQSSEPVLHFVNCPLPLGQVPPVLQGQLYLMTVAVTSAGTAAVEVGIVTLAQLVHAALYLSKLLLHASLTESSICVLHVVTGDGVARTVEVLQKPPFALFCVIVVTGAAGVTVQARFAEQAVLCASRTALPFTVPATARSQLLPLQLLGLVAMAADAVKRRAKALKASIGKSA